MSDVPTASIPKSWIWARILDVATTATGGTPSRSMSTYFGGNIPWVKSGELGDGHVFDTEETLSELGLKSSNAKLFPKGTLCIALYGATVGKLGILEVDAATNQAVCGLFLPDEVHRDFVFYYLASIRRHLIEQGKGGAQSNISNGLVRQTRIPIAPLTEQRRIVAKIEELFSDLDAGVAALKRAKANLKRYRASVLKSAVEGKLTEQWRAKHPAKEPASALLARILLERRQKWEADQLAKFAAAKKEPPKNWRDKYVEPLHETGRFELPESWTWASTLEICERVENGNTPPPNEMFEVDGEVPFIKVYNLTKNGSLDFSVKPTFVSQVTHETLLGRSRILPNDVLMNIVGPPLGKVSVVPNDYPEWNTNQAVVLFRASMAVLPRYLAACLMCDDVMFWITRTARATAGQSNISVGNSRILPIPIPPAREQAVIVETLDETLSQIDAAEMQIEHGLIRASRLRQSILKQAFEGKLVPQDPRDEPASTLLARLAENRTQVGQSATKPKAARRKAMS